MDNQVPKYVTQERAALLLGIPEKELSRISSESELGHTERTGDQKEVGGAIQQQETQVAPAVADGVQLALTHTWTVGDGALGDLELRLGRIDDHLAGELHAARL